jgi:hypothetical protein
MTTRAGTSLNPVHAAMLRQVRTMIASLPVSATIQQKFAVRALDEILASSRAAEVGAS